MAAQLFWTLEASLADPAEEEEEEEERTVFGQRRSCRDRAPPTNPT